MLMHSTVVTVACTSVTFKHNSPVVSQCVRLQLTAVTWLESRQLRRAQVVQSATTLLVKYIGMREPNVKYLGLQALTRLVHVPAVANILAR
jgi:hypothetical protein